MTARPSHWSRLAGLAVPVAAAPLLGWLILEGPVDLGGDKAPILLFPLALLLGLYLLIYAVMWWRGARTGKSICWAIAGSGLILTALWLLLLSANLAGLF